MSFIDIIVFVTDTAVSLIAAWICGIVIDATNILLCLQHFETSRQAEKFAYLQFADARK